MRLSCFQDSIGPDWEDRDHLGSGSRPSRPPVEQTAAEREPERMSVQLVARVLRLSAAALPALALSAWIATQAPAASGLFTGMEGSWRGDGTIDWKTGETERLRCNATYKVEADGNKLIQSLTCATDSTRLVIKSTINYNPDAGAVTGSWAETSYGISGFVTGRAAPGNVQAQVKSADNRFNARVTVQTRGGQQTVSIKPQDFDVIEVAVTLRKAGATDS